MVKRVLVVHEALARSLNDVSAVGLVVNYDLPRVVEDYSSRLVSLFSLALPLLHALLPPSSPVALSPPTI